MTTVEIEARREKTIASSEEAKVLLADPFKRAAALILSTVERNQNTRVRLQRQRLAKPLVGALFKEVKMGSYAGLDKASGLPEPAMYIPAGLSIQTNQISRDIPSDRMRNLSQAIAHRAEHGLNSLLIVGQVDYNEPYEPSQAFAEFLTQAASYETPTLISTVGIGLPSEVDGNIFAEMDSKLYVRANGNAHRDMAAPISTHATEAI